MKDEEAEKEKEEEEGRGGSAPVDVWLHQTY